MVKLTTSLEKLENAFMVFQPPQEQKPARVLLRTATLPFPTDFKQPFRRRPVIDDRGIIPAETKPFNSKPLPCRPLAEERAGTGKSPADPFAMQQRRYGTVDNDSPAGKHQYRCAKKRCDPCHKGFFDKARSSRRKQQHRFWAESTHLRRIEKKSGEREDKTPKKVRRRIARLCTVNKNKVVSLREGRIQQLPAGRDDATGKAHTLQDRVDAIAERAIRWSSLRIKPRAEKKLAITVFSFPPDKGNVGTAAYLDVFGSIHRVLEEMKAKGYDVQNLPRDGKTLMEAVINDPEALQGAPELSIAHRNSDSPWE